MRRKPVERRVKREGNILHTVKWRKVNWIGYIMCKNLVLNTLLKAEVTGRRGRWPRRLLDDFKETRGYWKLKKEALDRIIWRTGFGRGCGPVVRHSAEWMQITHVILESVYTGCETYPVSYCVGQGDSAWEKKTIWPRRCHELNQPNLN